MYELEQQKRFVSVATALVLHAVHGAEAPHVCPHRVSPTACGAFTACACLRKEFFNHRNVSAV